MNLYSHNIVTRREKDALFPKVIMHDHCYYITLQRYFNRISGPGPEASKVHTLPKNWFSAHEAPPELS